MTMASQPAQDGPVIHELDGAAPHPGSRWMRPFEVIAAALLVVMIAMILANVASRYVLSTPIIWADEIASMSFLWLAMIGAALAIDRNDHLRLTIFLQLFPDRIRSFVSTLALLLVAVFLVVMLRPAFEYAYEESYVTSPALELPMTYRAAALPFGMLLMAILAIAKAVRESTPRALMGSIATVAAIVAALFLLEPVFAGFGNCFYIACKIGGVSPDEAMGAIWPYLAALIVGLVIIAAVPHFSTFFV